MKLLAAISLVNFVSSEPQLDLPRVKSTSAPQENREGPEVLVLPNSYTDEKHDIQAKSDTNYGFDNDRSERYGLW